MQWLDELDKDPLSETERKVLRDAMVAAQQAEGIMDAEAENEESMFADE